MSVNINASLTSGLGITSDNSGQIQFQSDGVDTAIIDASGSVGINTTTPDALLTVNGVASFGDGSDATPSIAHVGDLDTGLWFPAANTIAISTGATERLRIDSSGNVGIGTTTPITSNARLSVKATDDYAAGITIGSNSSATNWANLAFKNTNATSANYIYQTQSGEFTIRTDGAYPLTFYTNGANERMRIDSLGNVGIGTANPEVPLDVQCDSGAFGIRLRGRTSDNISVLRFVNNAANTTYGQFDVRSDGFIINAVANVPMIFYTNNTERMRIDSSGNVGIGTISPTQTLTVNGSVGYNAPVTITAATYTVGATDNWIIANRAGTITLTLPAASSYTGRIITVKTIQSQAVISASSDVVPITSSSAGTAILSASDGKFATLVSDGTNWVIMQAN